MPRNGVTIFLAGAGGSRGQVRRGPARRRYGLRCVGGVSAYHNIGSYESRTLGSHRATTHSKVCSTVTLGSLFSAMTDCTTNLPHQPHQSPPSGLRAGDNDPTVVQTILAAFRRTARTCATTTSTKPPARRDHQLGTGLCPSPLEVTTHVQEIPDNDLYQVGLRFCRPERAALVAFYNATGRPLMVSVKLPVRPAS